MKPDKLKYGKKYVYYYPRLDESVLVTRTPPTPDGKWDYTVSIEFRDGHVDYPIHFWPDINHMFIKDSSKDRDLGWDLFKKRVPGFQYVGEL